MKREIGFGDLVIAAWLGSLIHDILGDIAKSIRMLIL
jgi:hypothetical protein